MANIFKLAKAYQRKHPRTDWQECIQKVKGKKRIGSAKKKPAKKSVKPVAKHRQTGSSNDTYDEMRHARPPGKRIPSGGDHVTYTERRKNRSDMPGKLTGVSSTQLTNELKERLKNSLGKQLVQRELAKTKTLKRKVSKAIVETRSRLKKLL